MLIGIILTVVLALAFLAASVSDESVQARRLRRRVRAAERQIHDIGRRTRRALLEEAQRQRRQRWP